MSEQLIGQPTTAVDPLPQNAVYFQVAMPAPLVNAQGVIDYKIAGPFPDIGSASQFAEKNPGSSLIASMVLYKTPGA